MTDPKIPTREQQKAQGAECPCRGVDDYCPCQNVVFTTRKSEKADTMDALLSERDALAAKVERLEEALEVVAHMGHDAPMTWAGSEHDWDKRRSAMMQSAARAALQENPHD